MTFWQAFKAQFKADFRFTRQKVTKFAWDVVSLTLWIIVSSWLWRNYHDIALGILFTLVALTVWSVSKMVWVVGRAVWKNAKAAAGQP